MNIFQSLSSLWHRESNKKDNIKDANNKRVVETVLEAKQKRYDEDEQILIAELPIVRNQLLEGIAEGNSIFHPDINLLSPSDFEEHPAILEKKLWWKGQGMYLRVMSSRMTSRLVFELEEDENIKLN
jgi:hypothetical protein